MVAQKLSNKVVDGRWGMKHHLAFGLINGYLNHPLLK